MLFADLKPALEAVEWRLWNRPFQVWKA